MVRVRRGGAAVGVGGGGAVWLEVALLGGRRGVVGWLLGVGGGWGVVGGLLVWAGGLVVRGWLVARGGVLWLLGVGAVGLQGGVVGLLGVLLVLLVMVGVGASTGLPRVVVVLCRHGAWFRGCDDGSKAVCFIFDEIRLLELEKWRRRRVGKGRRQIYDVHRRRCGEAGGRHTERTASPNRLDSEFVHSPREFPDAGQRSASQATRPRQPHDRVKSGHRDQKVPDGRGKFHLKI